MNSESAGTPAGREYRRWSLGRAILPGLAVVVLALSLGIVSSFATSRDAEAASLPEPVTIGSAVAQDNCGTFSYPYYQSNIYSFPGFPGFPGTPGFPGFPGYGTPFGYGCIGTAHCQTALVWWQYTLVCPGPPATMELPNTNSATCASATNITVKVRDANGLSVADGTAVSFGVQPFGQITGTVETNGGEATASLTTPTKTSGTLAINIAVGNVTRALTIEVTCSAPGSVAYGASAQGQTQTITIQQAPAQSMPAGPMYSGY